MKLRIFALSLFALLCVEAQYVFVGFTAPPSGTTVTVNLGGTTQVGTDSGNGLFMIATPFTVPSGGSNYSWGSNCEVYYVVGGAGENGCAIYADSSGSPGNLICGMASATSLTSAVWTAYSTSGAGCGTPTAGTHYWVAMITTDTGVVVEQGRSGVPASGEGCPSDVAGQSSVFSNSALGSFTGAASWPSSFGASTASNSCYTAYMPVTFTTTAAYSFAQVSNAQFFSSQTATIPATGSGHGGIFFFWQTAGSAEGTITITDSASDTITSRGRTCNSFLTGDYGLCVFSVDRISSGVTSFVEHCSSVCAHDSIMFIECIGCASSSSYDVSDFDTSLQGTPSTSGATGSKAQNQELCVGGAYNTDLTTVGNASFLFSAGTGWNLIHSGWDVHTGPNDNSMGSFYRITSTSGTETLKTSFGTAGTNNLLGLGCFK